MDAMFSSDDDADLGDKVVHRVNQVLIFASYLLLFTDPTPSRQRTSARSVARTISARTDSTAVESELGSVEEVSPLPLCYCLSILNGCV